MARKRKTSFIIGSGYIGSGNKFSVLSQKVNSPFEKIKSVYGDELQRQTADLDNGIKSEPLSKEQRIELKNRVKKIVIAERRNRIYSLIFSIGLTFAIIVTSYYVIGWFIRHYS